MLVKKNAAKKTYPSSAKKKTVPSLKKVSVERWAARNRVSGDTIIENQTITRKAL